MTSRRNRRARARLQLVTPSRERSPTEVYVGATTAKRADQLRPLWPGEFGKDGQAAPQTPRVERVSRWLGWLAGS